MFLPIVYLPSALFSLIGITVISRICCEQNCDPFDVSQKSAEIQLSKNRLPFTIKLSVDAYREEETIKVNIGNTLNSSFGVQIRSIETNESVGHFERWPESHLQLLLCDKSVNSSILVATRPLNSSDVTFYWRSPPFDKGTLTLIGIFIKNGEYWIVKEDGPKIYHHLSRTKKDMSSLMCYGADKYCKTKEGCGYEMNYGLVDTQKLKILLESYSINDNVYLTVILTRNLEQLIHLMNIGNSKYQEVRDSVIMTCTMADGVSVKTYPDGENAVIDYSTDIGGNNYRCLFFVSLNELKGGDKKADIQYAYFWGKTNYSNKEMILPPIEDFGILFRPLLDDEVVNVSCYEPINRAAEVLTISKFLYIFIIVCLRSFC